MRFWLVKTEPETYSFGDLTESGHCWWDGVRNYQARNNLKSMARGDLVVVYHSNTTPPGAVGVARVTEDARPDETQFDHDSLYHDPMSTRERPRWVMVGLEPVCQYRSLVPLKEMRESRGLRDSVLVRRGNRLSVVELSGEEYEAICGLGEAQPMAGGGPFH